MRTKPKHNAPQGVAALAAWMAAPAWAHPGHGLPDPSHWHSTDTIGFVLAALAIGAAVWLARRK